MYGMLTDIHKRILVSKNIDCEDGCRIKEKILIDLDKNYPQMR